MAVEPATVYVGVAYLGVFLAVLSTILLVLEALEDGWQWFLACLLIPGALPVWLATHWDRGREPFRLGAVGGFIMAAGWYAAACLG